MGSKRVLLMHISGVSGHRCASLAIEKALRELDGNVQTYSIDAFNYSNPFWERFINRLYMFVIRVVPHFWEYLYDNKKVMKKLKKIRFFIHEVNDKKVERLFADIKPDIVVCTQAFPCGMVADYKRRHKLNLPLMGVLTDYAPHGYWLNDLVDTYVVPDSGIQQRLQQRSIPFERLKVLGIPIDTKFISPSNREEIFRRLELDPHSPVILIMGGGQGLGPIKKIVETLDKMSCSAQMAVVCGTNQRLYNWLKKKRSVFSKPLCVMGYTEHVHDLMSISSFIVTKPGGLTTAEALSKSLPIIIVNPLPGQESLNTQFLVENGIALKVNSLNQLQSLAEELLRDGLKLRSLGKKAACFAHPDSALKVSQLILEMIKGI